MSHLNAASRDSSRPMSPLVHRLTVALVILSLTLIAVTAGIRVLQGHRFDFHRIVVKGELTHVDRAVVRAALVGHLHGNFFTMHLGETRRALESIPWVARVTVRRVWPGRIEILLTERHPIGIWSDGRLLSDEGVLFDGNLAEPDANKGAMNFSAPPDMAAIVVASIPGYVQRLGNMKMTLSGIDVSNRMSWTVHAREGASLILGRDDPPGTVMTRLDDIVQHYPQVIERTGSTPRRIDARYNNGFAVSKS